jgi:hypothetical protein
LAAYAPRFTARTTCTNFQDLIQQSNENVHDYYLRVSDAFKKMCEAKPATISATRIDRGAATAEQAAAVKLEGVKDSEGFFEHQIFIPGLKEDIPMKIMEAGKPSIQESVAHARELEVIHEDRKKGSPVGNIGAQDNNDYNLDDEERTAVDAIHLQRGRQPYQQPGQQSNNQGQQSVQEILDRDNKANNNSNPSPANADIAKSKVTIRRTVVKEKQLKPQWSM